MTENKINFLIITPLKEELDAVLNKLPKVQESSPFHDDIRTYYLSNLPVIFADGTTGTYRIVVTLSGMGRVPAANATSDAIRRWQPDYVLLVGIAGGFANAGVKLGDVLVSDQIVDYESQKTTSDGHQVRYEVHRADQRLLGASQNLRDNVWQQKITTARPENGVPVSYIGPILSGDKSVAVGEVLAGYAKDWPKLKGVEMEAGGVASASFQAVQRPGFFMIRGVSDLADEDEKTYEVQQWRSYACDVAASYTVALLESGRVPLTNTSPNSPINELDKSELNLLKKLLIESKRTSVLKREILATDIGIKSGEIPQFMLLADDDLAKQIVDLLWKRRLREKLLNLCEILQSDFEGGEYSSKLEGIIAKLKYQ
ncbi:MAG TPA: 5'-methylthioadenosine/S-adenosylhomocysteine nucleosidase [Leptolyngbyaceae cyanobacterium]